MGLRRFLILVAAVTVILLIITAWVLPSNEDFRVENPFWNGTSQMEKNYTIQPVWSLAALPASPRGKTLILVPYLTCNTAEMEGLSRFITDGGTLVLADDYGYGNRVLDYLGLEARFSGPPLLDPLLNFKTQYFPMVNTVNNAFTGNSTGLVLNHATCLMNVTAADTIAQSSSFSFLDRNDNGTWDEDEPTGPLPVISRHDMGSGQIILVADPSLFINSMATMEGNEGFRRYIAATDTTLYLDQSHLPPTELDQTKSILRGLRAFLATPVTTAALVILILIILLRPIWHKKDDITEEV